MTGEGPENNIEQSKVQRGPRKIRTGSAATGQSATDEELQPKPFQPDLFELNSSLVAALPVLIVSDHCRVFNC